MSVLSKLVNAVAPKSVAGVLLWMLPIAAAVIVVAYPQAITQLFVRDDPERLLEELTAGDTHKRKRAGGAKKSNGAGPKKAVIVEAPRESDEEATGPSDEEQLLHLASLQGRTTTSQSKKESKAAEARSPAVTPISLNEDSKSNSEDGWKRVPTREEEAIGNLKSRIAALSKQLEDSRAEFEATKGLLDNETRRAAEAEKELKERSRTFQSRWLDLENEIGSLKATRDSLIARVNELCAAQSAADAQEQMIQTLNGRIVELEQEVSEASATREKLASLASSENAARTELSECQLLLAKEQGLLAAEKALSGNLRQQLESATARVSELGTNLQEAQKHETDLENKLKSMEGDLKETQSRLASIAVEKAAINGELSNVKKQLVEAQLVASKSSDDELLIESQKKEIAELREMIEDLKKVSEEIKEKVSELEHQKALLEEDNQKLKQEIEAGKQTLKQEIEAEKPSPEEEAKRQEQLEDLQSECRKLSDQLCEANETIAEKSKALESAEKRLSIMNSVTAAKYAAYEKDINELKAEREELLRKTPTVAQSHD